MNSASRRLDHDGGFVGEVIGDRMQLALMSDQPGRPATAGVAAIAGLEPGTEVTEGDSFARALPTRRASRARGFDPAGLAAEHWFDHRPASVEARRLRTSPTTS